MIDKLPSNNRIRGQVLFLIVFSGLKGRTTNKGRTNITN